MKSHGSAAASDYTVGPVATNAGGEPHLVDSFEFRRASECSVELGREIAGFLDSQDTSHPFQFPQWGNGQSYFAFCRRQGIIGWFAQCSVYFPAGRFLRAIRALAVNHGPVCDEPELMGTGLRWFVEEGRRQGFAYIDIAPEWTGVFAEFAATALAQNGWQELAGARSSLRLELTPSHEELLAGFRKVTRYEIRRSEAQGVTVAFARDEAGQEEFFRLYRDLAVEKNFVTEDFGHLRRVLRWLAQENDRGGLLIAEKDGSVIGAIVIVRSGRRCWYVLGATSKEQKLSAGHLLHWHAIQWAKNVGCLEYDFSGGDSRTTVDQGTAFFKQGFCENLVEFLRPQRRVLSESKVRICNLVKGIRDRFRRRPDGVSAGK